MRRVGTGIEPALNRRGQILRAEGLGHVPVHARREIGLAVSLHGVGGECDDAHTPAARRSTISGPGMRGQSCTVAAL